MSGSWRGGPPHVARVAGRARRGGHVGSYGLRSVRRTSVRLGEQVIEFSHPRTRRPATAPCDRDRQPRRPPDPGDGRGSRATRTCAVPRARGRREALRAAGDQGVKEAPRRRAPRAYQGGHQSPHRQRGPWTMRCTSSGGLTTVRAQAHPNAPRRAVCRRRLSTSVTATKQALRSPRAADQDPVQAAAQSRRPLKRRRSAPGSSKPFAPHPRLDQPGCQAPSPPRKSTSAWSHRRPTAATKQHSPALAGGSATTTRASSCRAKHPPPPQHVHRMVRPPDPQPSAAHRPPVTNGRIATAPTPRPTSPNEPAEGKTPREAPTLALKRYDRPPASTRLTSNDPKINTCQQTSDPIEYAKGLLICTRPLAR